MTLPAIATLVPHGGAMLLLDRVCAADADTLCAEVAIGPDSLFCADGMVGAWIGIEYMAQAVAAHAGYVAQLRGGPVRVGFLLGTRRYECAAAGFAAGSILNVHVERVLQGENGLGAYACRIADGRDGAELAQATITVFQPDNVEEFLQRSSE